jgi:DNA-binding transcriptional regulator YiaG
MVGGVAMVSSSRALRDKDIWDKDLISGYAYYQHKKSDDANSIITHYISDITDTGKLTLLPHDQALQVLEKFGVYPTLLHLILAVHTYRKIDPTNTKIELTGTDLIKDLGLDKRKHLTKQEKFKRVLECLTAVKSLVISASWQSVVKFKEKGKWKKKDLPLYLPPTVMWNISELLIPQENSLGENEIKEIEIVVKAGAWLDHFFNRNGKSLGQALYNYATFAKSILDLDPYREELALRIALIQSTMDYRQYHTVEKWLIENLPNGKKRISDAKNDHRSRKKLKDSWDRNLLALERIGFKIDFDDKGSYPQELRPANESNPRGYWDKLLNGKIKITPPRLNKPESNNEKQERLEREAKKKLSSTKNYSGSELKQARESANVKPTAIAKYLDCSKGRIYNAEKRQSISPKIYKEIMDAINYIKKHPDKYQ